MIAQLSGGDAHLVGAGLLDKVLAGSRADWSEEFQEDKITPSDGAEAEEFGWGVAIDGGYAIVGAAAQPPGSAYIYNACGAVTGIEYQGFAGHPAHFTLCQNVPNPFNPATTITYDLPHASDVKLTLYTITGKEVAVLTDVARPSQ